MRLRLLLEILCQFAASDAELTECACTPGFALTAWWLCRDAIDFELEELRRKARE